VKVTAFRTQQKDFEQFFITRGELSSCKNVEGLMAAMNIRYNPDEWRPFTDSSMHSLKALLLHEGNVLPSVPVVYAVHKKKHMTT
jgi:arabinogalactan endo-1,4-beta-galactosidase